MRATSPSCRSCWAEVKCRLRWASDSAGAPESEILHSAKEVADDEDKIADQQHYESAVNMRNCDVGVEVREKAAELGLLYALKSTASVFSSRHHSCHNQRVVSQERGDARHSCRFARARRSH